MGPQYEREHQMRKIREAYGFVRAVCRRGNWLPVYLVGRTTLPGNNLSRANRAVLDWRFLCPDLSDSDLKARLFPQRRTMICGSLFQQPDLGVRAMPSLRQERVHLIAGCGRSKTNRSWPGRLWLQPITGEL